jgi:hypothetical protein
MDQPGKPETLEKAQDLMSVFWKALLEDMTKKGVKIDNEAEAKSEAERLSGKILIDSGEYEA